jgi:hypothetical protein
MIGADPELFMKHPDTGDFVSAHDRIPGTKKEPHKVPFGAIQVDGTALEFNIDPANSADEFTRNILNVKETITNYVPGYNVVAEPVATFKPDYFDWDIPPIAKELGCDPDYNAYTLMVNPRPNPGNRPIRTGAGHIHIGWTENEDVFDDKHFAVAAKVARQMDYYLGIHSLLWDSDTTRRKLYGQAGAFRPKPYGVEYRTLSNRWLSDPHLIRWVYNQAFYGTKIGFMFNLWAENTWAETAKNIINNNLLDWEKSYPALSNYANYAESMEVA